MRLPYNPHADNAGNIPSEGDFVAYNYSGQVATGIIIFVARSNRDNLPLGRFKIRQVLPEEGHISRVNGGAKCMLVLKKAGEK